MRWPTPIFKRASGVLSGGALGWLRSLAHAQSAHTRLWEPRGTPRYLAAHVSAFARESEEARRYEEQLVDGIERHAGSMLRALGQHPFMTRYHRQAASQTRLSSLEVRLCTLELHRVLKGGYSPPAFSAGARRARGGDGLGGDQDGLRAHALQGRSAPGPPEDLHARTLPRAAPGACPKGLRHLVGFIFVEAGQAGQAGAATGIAPDGVHLMDPRILRPSPGIVHTIEPQPGLLVIFPSLVQFYVQSARSPLAAVYFELLVQESRALSPDA